MSDRDLPLGSLVFYGMWGNGWAAWQILELQRDIAKRYGVSQRTISLITRRETWTHVP